ncbi:MAG: winged helix-turn-helix domain-containing protein [Rhodanobacteraceae bacterium]
MLKTAEDHPDAPAISRVRVADLTVDLGNRTVSRGKRRLPVRGRSFQLLQALIEQHPDIAEHRHLLEVVWPNRIVTTDALTQRVRLLRQALDDTRSDDGYIASVHGQGYRLTTTPQPLSASAPARHTGPGNLVYWLVLVAVIILLWLLLRPGNAHILKHFFRHLLP